MMEDLFADRAVRGRTLSRKDAEALVTAGNKAGRREAGGPQHLIDCDLEEADLSRLDLTEWTFERCGLRHTDFTGARLDGTKWLSCKGATANFSGAVLTDALFQSSDFNNASFRGATLASAMIRGCKLTGADLSDAKSLNLRLEETLAISARMPSLGFRKQTLLRVDFSQADLRKCDFRATVFEECSLRDAHVVGAHFENADLRGADLGGFRLTDASLFRGATISRAQAGQLLGELGLKVG